MTQTELKQKEDIISQLKNIDNSLVLQRIADFIQGVLAASNSTTDWWDELPEAVQQDYVQGLKEMETGEEEDVDDFLKKYR